MTVTSNSDKYAAREAYIKSIATKHRALVTGMTTEVELTWNGEPYLRFRIFRSDGEWITVKHAATKSKVMREIGIDYEIEGEREDRSLTRESALGWIALHWSDVVDRMMKENS